MEVRDVVAAVRELNALRLADPAAAERLADTLFGASSRLVVYGSLMPGESNHGVVAPLGGAWMWGVVEGDLETSGWGAALGHRALRPRLGGPRVRAALLASEKLRDAWDDLDRFEGAEYRRVWIPFRDGAGEIVAVGNVYEASVAR